MIKDIEIPKVEDIGVAVIKDEKNEEDIWNVYIINYKNVPIDNVLISSKGYGVINEKKKTTSTLRHYFEQIKERSFQLIEPISAEVFGLNNEYFVTFYIDKMIHDKKFIFVPEAIQKDHFTTIHIIEKQGVLIK